MGPVKILPFYFSLFWDEGTILLFFMICRAQIHGFFVDIIRKKKISYFNIKIFSVIILINDMFSLSG